MILFQFVLVVICVGISSGERRIINGKEALPGQFPYQVSLRLDPHTVHYCAGSIISNKHILTAGHCVYKLVKSFKNNGKAVVGTNDLRSGGTKYKISNIIYHPFYDPTELFHDIAIIRVCGLIKFNNVTKPIALQTTEIKFHSLLTASGWGCSKCQGKNGIEYSNKLLYSELLIVELGYCQNALTTVFEGTICAASDCDQGVCFGDSGGPLVYQGRLAGIVSAGKNCVPCAPDAVTNVSVC